VYTCAPIEQQVISVEIFVFVSEQWILVSLLLLMIYAFVWRESSKGGPSVSYHQLTQAVNADTGIVLDLRDKKDFNAGHIAGSVNIPHSKISDRASELEESRGKQIILVDKFGQHTGAVGKHLMGMGHSPARLKGGMAEWQGSNLPLVKD
jgi:rhodanese-related sulfurtransferase|tara:strand:- start:2720 stop:3169 length:450 start_codon:yes stop_codon:yes gene_type:complete